jgi:hypothetical protein
MHVRLQNVLSVAASNGHNAWFSASDSICIRTHGRQQKKVEHWKDALVGSGYWVLLWPVKETRSLSSMCLIKLLIW